MSDRMLRSLRVAGAVVASVVVLLQCGRARAVETAEATFAKYDADKSDTLDARELREFVRDQDPLFSTEGWKAKETKDPELAKTITDEIQRRTKKILVYGHPPTAPDATLTLEDFRQYYKEQVPGAETDDWLGQLFGKRLKIRKTFLEVKGNELPAQLNWTQPIHQSSVFTIDGALSYALWEKNFAIGSYPSLVTVDPTVEAHTSSSSKAQQNSISAKLPAQLYATPGLQGTGWFPQYVVSNYASLAAAYETDKSKKTETYGGEFFYSPSIPKLGIGTPLPAVQNTSAPYVLWRPYLGMDGGYASQDKKDQGGFHLPREYARLTPKVHVETWALGRFELAADYYNRKFVVGSGRAFNYVEVSPILYLDSAQHLSVGITYKNGRSTPKFSQVNSVGAFVGFKF